MAFGVHGGNGADGPDWLKLLREDMPRVAEGIGSAHFSQRLVDALHLVLQFDWWMVMVYRQNSNPEMLCENFTDSWRKRGLTTYVGAFYLLDPFYTMSLSLDHPEVCRLDDIAPDGFLESEYHRAHYARGKIGDEVGYLWPLEPGVTFAVSLERSEHGAPFSDEDVYRLEAVQPLLYALARKHWTTEPSRSATASELEIGRLVQQAAAKFGQDVLTPRECEVVKLVLRGYSTKSLSQTLGISPGTVKVHRENIYSKLGISSQAELFNRFITSVSASPGSRNQA